MHNNYITDCCIRSKDDKLLLIKYEDTDITKISPLLYNLTLELMNQCYHHVKVFHEKNMIHNEKYKVLEPLVTEQLEDMTFIKMKFIEFFSKSGAKSKSDLLTYIFAFQMSLGYLNEYLHNALFFTLKSNFDLKFWEANNLDSFKVIGYGEPDFYILRDTKEECSTGLVNLNYQPCANKIENYVRIYNSMSYDLLSSKLRIIKELAKTLDNYDSDHALLKKPYQTSTLQLIDNIIVSREMERPKTYIKRQ
jgi:hypothetical protein